MCLGLFETLSGMIVGAAIAPAVILDLLSYYTDQESHSQLNTKHYGKYRHTKKLI